MNAKFLLPMMVAIGAAAPAQTFPLDSLDGLKMWKVKAMPAEYKGHKGIKVIEDSSVAAAANDRGEDRLVILTKSDFQDGVIEAEVSGQVAAGAPGAARGFVGIAFRVNSGMSK